MELTSVLVVDDHEDTANLIARLLTKAGHFACQAYSGEQALAALSEIRFDLVVLDYMMPGMNGSDVLQAIRGSSDPGTRHVAVVFYSAGGSWFGEDGRGQEAQDYIPKGMPWEQVYARLRPYLSSH
jgi:DNA-binding response OmpR family regulator